MQSNFRDESVHQSSSISHQNSIISFMSCASAKVISTDLISQTCPLALVILKVEESTSLILEELYRSLFFQGCITK